MFHILSHVRWALRVSLVTHRPPGTAWQLGEKQETGSVKAWNSLSALCKHIIFTHMVLWFPRSIPDLCQHTIWMEIFLSCHWSKTKSLHLIYAAHSFRPPIKVGGWLCLCNILTFQHENVSLGFGPNELQISTLGSSRRDAKSRESG